MTDALLMLVAYQHGDETIRPGVAVDGYVVPLSEVTDGAVDLVQACPHSPDAAREFRHRARQALHASGEVAVKVENVTLCPPVQRPEKIICLGLNYRDHASEAGLEEPEAPILFAKFPNCLVGNGAEIVIPTVSDQIDFEGELAVVIGTRCKNVSREDALDYVAGYAVFNDVTARDVQLRTSQWTAGKAIDTFAPFGPGIVPSGVLTDPQQLHVTTRVNDVVMQDDSTSLMIFDVAETVAYISALMTLEPGDIIATGTPAGVGFKQDPPVFLRPGDTVAITIEGIGTLTNPVVAGS